MVAVEAEFRHRIVTVRGSSIHVVEAGDPVAAPFSFLHGWPGSWRSREQVAPAGTWRLIADFAGLTGR